MRRPAEHVQGSLNHRILPIVRQNRKGNVELAEMDDPLSQILELAGLRRAVRSREVVALVAAATKFLNIKDLFNRLRSDLLRLCGNFIVDRSPVG